ncbi:MAG: TetR family transcriptional regulator [Alphaproteobacteria bacterium]|nr:TetR family transcriptional regulator [Alphaproteobacteria bacterium]
MAPRKPARARPAKKSAPRAKSRVTRTVRRRRTPEEARGEILAAARQLLLDEGPDAVTIQRVSAAVGMTHGNLLHHFGSAAELQSDLMAIMVRDLTEALDSAVRHLRSDAAAPRALIDIVFDAFSKGGAGKLAAWIALSHNFDHLDGIQEAVASLVEAIEEKFARAEGIHHRAVTSAVLMLAFMAFGDALLGQHLSDMLDRERAAPRKVATFLLPSFFAME